MANKKIKQRVKIDDTRYDIQLDINAIAGLNTILSSKMDKELVVGNFTAHENYLPLAVLEEDGKYYLKANTNFKLDSSKANYILTQAGTWILNNNHTHNYQSPLSNMSISEGESGTATTARSMRADYLKSIILHHSPAGSRPASDVSAWAKTPTKPSYSISEVTGLQSALDNKANSNHSHSGTYSPVVHNHDDRYYTETEVDAKLGDKANTSHNHDASNINTGTLSVNRIPSLSQSKITNLTTDLNNKVSYGETIMNTNPFGGKKLYINSINNAIFNADLRWTVTAKRYRKSDNVFIADVPTYNLFNGDYEGGITAQAGEYLVINIKFLNSGSIYNGVSVFPGYPYGYVYISHYYTNYSESAKLRVYCNYAPHGIGWHEVNFTDFVRIGDGNLILQARQSKYAISEMELIITAKDDTRADITQIDFKLDRPGSNEMPLLDKLKNQIMYKDINFKGQARPKINGVDLITTDDPRLSDSRPASDVSSWAKASTKPSYGWSEIGSKPTFATVSTSGSYDDLSDKPTIPSIPSVMTTTEGNAGTATTQRTINAANLKTIILNHSPAGSRPASDVKSWAKASTKPEYNFSEIKTTPTTISGYGITDAYTKTETNTAISEAISTVYKYKGSKASYTNLPSTGNVIGDVWNVEDTDHNYAWTGTAWDKLGGTVNLSTYATQTWVNSQGFIKSFTNNYLTGVSGSGNGTVTFTRKDLDNLTWDTSHNHDGRYYTEAETDNLLSTLLSNKQDKNIPYSAFASSLSGNYVPFLLYDSATGQYHLKRSNLAFAPNDAGARFFYLSAYGTWEEAQSGGTGGGDVYEAGNNVFTGTNTFNNAIKIDRTDYHFTNSSGTKFQLPYDTSGSGTTVTLAREEGTWELLRARTATTSLSSVNSGTTSGSVSLTKSISQGDVLAIELNSTSLASYNPIVLTITIQRISTDPNSYNYDYNLESFTSWTGTELRVNNFSISASGTNLYFGNKKYIKGSFSGSTIEWTTNQSYTLYVGRVWRLVQ